MHSVHAALLLYSEDLGRLEYITLKNTKVLLDVYNKLIGFFFFLQVFWGPKVFSTGLWNKITIYVSDPFCWKPALFWWFLCDAADCGRELAVEIRVVITS